MKRWLPHPVLSLALLALWLLLNGATSVGTWLMGVVLAWLAPWLSRTLIPAGEWPRAPLVLVKLFFRVSADVIRSAFVVAWLIVRPGGSRPTGRFVRLTLSTDNPYAIAALQVITAAIPGTVWCGHDRRTREVLLHVLDVHDEPAFIADFQARYELPLHRIFP